MGWCDMTSRQIAEVRRMNRAGMNDSAIADVLGLPQNTVWYCRTRMGLPVVLEKRNTMRYTVYDGKTSEYLFEGTARECAERMGIERQSFNRAHSLFLRGRYRKYEIYAVGE